ncbi:hydrogenase maturation nickel metallochaperone HypA/HybF [Calothrix sp. 336/3]|uniref:hydrogenase maturation nickel metallochaperone HypA/HybF n=1 Tax=Calothrix sp. 336/3 TaxID=1337936 RepID=UPI0004E2C165|nr:hydrogenase maturation nickel metallochaperone HypA [Calothrix sp. 336/3]AKG23777.1 hydrogenase nickel incorporation protein HypA [Calothrix sp. 336/3]
MHELGITQNIVAIASEYAEGKKVSRVLLEIGKLSAIMPDAIRFCFDICSQGTVLAEAKLEIREISGLGKCQNCGAEIPLTQLFGQCICGSTNISLIAGEELKIKEIEVE